MIYSLYNQKWVNGNFHPHIVAYYFKEWQDFYMQKHRHNQIEIMYVMNGKCTVNIIDKSIYLVKGDLIIIDANTSHNLEVAKDVRCRMLNIEFIYKKKTHFYPSFREVVNNTNVISLFINSKQPYHMLKDNNEIFPILKNIILELDENKNGDELLILQYITELFIKISRLYEQRTADWGPGNIYVRKATRFLLQNYDQDVKVVDIASALNIHEAYLHRIFKTCTGSTPIEYLTDLRMEKAKMLLIRTDIPIIEISDYIGINSRQYFTTLFKKHTGKTPSEYRKSYEKFEGFS